MDAAVQEAKLLRQVNTLIVAHLHDQNLTQAAVAVAAATMTPSPPRKTTPRPPTTSSASSPRYSPLYAHPLGLVPAYTLAYVGSQGLAVERRKRQGAVEPPPRLIPPPLVVVAWRARSVPVRWISGKHHFPQLWHFWCWSWMWILIVSYMHYYAECEGPFESFPKHDTRHSSDHKVRIVLLRPSSMRHMSLHLCQELNLKSSGQ
jgi:hypothetical protein